MKISLLLRMTYDTWQTEVPDSPQVQMGEGDSGIDTCHNGSFDGHTRLGVIGSNSEMKSGTRNPPRA